MKRLILLTFLAFGVLAAQEHGSEAKEEHHGGGSSELMWKVVNFALLAAGLGYLLAKNLPPVFRSRTDEIQKGIRDAAKLRDDAEAKAAEIEARMKNLGAEIESVRQTAAGEFARESERMKAENAEYVARAKEQAQVEIASAAKSARMRLKALSADLAIQLAGEKVKAAMNPETENAMIEGFVGDLRKRAETEVH
jgi:F-type H+-transporting ATPase subunit b